MEYLFKALETAIENAAEQRQSAQPGAPPREPRAKPPKPKAQPKPSPAPDAPATFAETHAPKRAGGLVPVFEDGNSIVRALVAAEVLGPPVALREPSIWSLRPNEPSI